MARHLRLKLKRFIPQSHLITCMDYSKIYPPVGLWLIDKPHEMSAIAVAILGKIMLADCLYITSNMITNMNTPQPDVISGARI